MAFLASAVGRVRTDGSDENGAFYDAAISGAATDYTDQAAHQLSLTDLATSGAGSTTLTSATGGFTSAMIGNAIRIRSGTNFTTGYYFITARTDTNTVTLDRTPSAGGAGSSGAGKVGGAALTIKKVCDDANATNEKCVAGNTIYIRGAGGSPDYSFTGFFTVVPGTLASGRTRLIGYNTRPKIQSNGLMLYLADAISVEGLDLSCSSNSNGTLGIVYATASVLAFQATDTVFDCNNQTSQVAVSMNGGALVGCEIKGGRSAASSGGYGVECRGSTNTIKGCNIRNMGDAGIYGANSGVAIEAIGNRIYANYLDGIRLPTGLAGMQNTIKDNTIDANEGHGVSMQDATSVAHAQISSNQITHHTVSGKKGINVAAGTTALNDRLKGFIDYNNVYGNDGNYGAISAGAHDTSQDPGYVAASSGNHTPASSEDSLGYPAQFLNATGSINYVAKGAIQRLVSGSSNIILSRQATLLRM